MQISGMDAPTKSGAIHVNSGYLIIDDTNTDGYLFVQGFKLAAIVDESSGTFFWNKDELKETTDDESRRKSKAKVTLSV